LQSDCSEKGICNPQLKDRAKGEGLQIPLFNAAGLQIHPNGQPFSGNDKSVATAVLQTMFVTLPAEKGKKFNKIEKSDFANKKLLRRFSFPRIRCTFVGGKERNFSNYNQ